MKHILSELKTAILFTLVSTVILCGFYPLLVWGGSLLLFPHQANGSLIQGTDGKTYGSSLLGQNFSGSRYFLPRPSAAGSNGYDAGNSSGSNLGPTSRKLNDAIEDRIKQYRSLNHLPPDAGIPADAATASASGLDPHISVKNALIQLPHIARERGRSEAEIEALVKKYTDSPYFSILGNPGVNVLKLNLALDGKLTP